jgi:hypothetical protein
MFSFISMNWRGRPLTSDWTIVELISATTTTKGPRIKSERHTEWYPVGVKISEAAMAALPSPVTTGTATGTTRSTPSLNRLRGEP